MWIFSKSGFFSIVKKDGAIQIRARHPEHLQRLVREYELDVDLILTPDADYCSRVVIDADSFPDLMARMARDVDYSNVKTAVGKTLQDPVMEGVMVNAWRLLWNFQACKFPRWLTREGKALARK